MVMDKRYWVTVSVVSVVLFVGLLSAFWGVGKITGFSVAQTPLSLRLVKDYSFGDVLSGDLVLRSGVFNKDIAIVGFVDKDKRFDVLLKDLLDSSGVNYNISGNDLTTDRDLVVKISGLNVTVPANLGIYSFSVGASDGSFGDSVSFDVVS